MMRRIVSVILIVVMMASITANLVFADPVVLQPPQRNRVTIMTMRMFPIGMLKSTGILYISRRRLKKGTSLLD